MSSDASWWFFSDGALVNAAAGMVLAYLGGHLAFPRGVSAATRALGLMLCMAALNMLGGTLWRAAYHPATSLTGMMLLNASAYGIPFFLMLFVYLFADDDRPRERAVMTVLFGLPVVASLARVLAIAAYADTYYQPSRHAYNYAPRGTPAESLLALFGGNVAGPALLASYAWCLFALVRKCVSFQRADGGSAPAALFRPCTPRVRAVRDFVVLTALLVGAQAIVFTGVRGIAPILFHLLACALVWVYVNHSSEPTSLRFKLVAVPLGLVVGLQALLFLWIVRDDTERVHTAWEDEVRRIRTLVERSAPAALDPVSVAPDVRFVVARPAAHGAYSPEFDVLLARDGFRVGDLLAADHDEQEWLVRSWADTEAERRDLREALRSGETPRWSRQAGGTLFYGATQPQKGHYLAHEWESDGVAYHVGRDELTRRRAYDRLAAPFVIVVLATGVGLVLGLPILFRGSVLRPIRALMAGAQRVEAGDLTGIIDVQTSDEFGLLARSFDRMVGAVSDARDRLERINAAAFRFVPRPFLKKLGHESILSVELGDQSRLRMAVLFADVRGFTSLSERMTPAETFSFVNGLLRELGPVVRRHGGFIDKYLGDAIMALFDGGADAAMSAAVEIRAAVATFNAARADRGEAPVRVGIGLHAGDLMLGVIGEAERIDGTVLADAVNTASRLEGLTKRYDATIVVSSETLAELTDATRFEHRFLERVRIKGREQPVDVHEVFSGDDPEDAAAKRATRDALQAAVRAMGEGRFGEAASALRDVLRASPDDPVVRLHLDRATLFAEQGAPEDWDGVHRMEGK